MKNSNDAKAEHFIPFTQDDIVAMLVDNGPIEHAQEKDYREVSQLIASLYHYKFHQQLISLKQNYQPYNPDRDTHLLSNHGKHEDCFSTKLTELLVAANYSQITQAELNAALDEESLFKIRLFVNFDDFEDCLIYSRGSSEKTETISSFFGLRKKNITFINYERIVLYLKYKGEDKKLLKLFRNVPKADLEMLFPNTEIRMRLTDKLLIGLPAAVSGGVVVSTKLGGTFLLIGGLIGFWLGLRNEPVRIDESALLGLAAGLGALGGYLWKQFNNFKNRKMHFLKTLTENLYFKTLDNNAGVFHRLLDAAEEEECKEAFLAYAFLLNLEKPISKEKLDQNIEKWFKDHYDCKLDFEIEDALKKLIRLDLVSEENAHFKATTLTNALITLKREWQALIL